VMKKGNGSTIYFALDQPNTPLVVVLVPFLGRVFISPR